MIDLHWVRTLTFLEILSILFNLFHSIIHFSLLPIFMKPQIYGDGSGRGTGGPHDPGWQRGRGDNLSTPSPIAPTIPMALPIPPSM